MHSTYLRSSILKIVSIKLILLCALSLILFNLCLPGAQAQKPKKPESPTRVLVVKDYKWGSAGMGRSAIMSEITIENRSDNDYKDLSVEVDFYTSNDIPLGSLRTTINEILPARSEKTFYNVKFGIMHSELKNSVARIVNAELIEKGTPTQARDLILVKNWEWTGGQYGTEGILKEVTLDNRSNQAWKDIEINVNFLGIKGGKMGVKGFTSRAVIHDVLPPRSTRTYMGVNVGFRHPDAKEVSISVRRAKPISDKELKIKLAKKEGKKAVKKKKRKKPAAPGEEGYDETESAMYDESGKRLSLSERYKRKLAEEQGIAPPPADTGSTQTDTTTTSDDKVALSDDTPEKTESTVKEAITAPKDGEPADIQTAEQADDTAVSEDDEEYEYEYEEEVPLPTEDIVVEDFTFSGSVPQTMGRITEITLRNLSEIPYTKIELKIDFFSFKEEAPMFSNRATIVDVLPAKEKKTFRNIEAGFLNAIPQEVRIQVLDAIPFSQY